MSNTTATQTASNNKSDLREQAQTVKEDLKEFGAIGKRAVEETAEMAALRAQIAKEDAVSKAHDLEDQVVKYIREQPVKSVLIAAGVGALASMWMRR